MLRNLVISKPTTSGRASYTLLAAALLQVYASKCPSLLFRDDPTGQNDSKPFSYLFINLLLIDLRSSFPSLLPRLNSVEYPAISRRLAAAFDIISSFIGFLVRSLDEEAGSFGFSMPPDLLLKLRKDIAETMSLTIEYLRERWDASVAGASGLHPSARSETVSTSEGKRLTLKWESMKDRVSADPLILAGIRALAIWIREDENENLRNETAGLMDMIIDLYKTSSQSSLDFRYAVLLALEGIMITEDVVDNFLGQDGWQVIFEDLQSILMDLSKENVDNPFFGGEAERGIQIIRVLLTVLDHESTRSPKEAWMTAITATAAIRTHGKAPPIIIELYTAMLQLSMALLTKSAHGILKRYINMIAPLSGLVSQLEAVVKTIDNQDEATELNSLLEDVSLDLENLRPLA